MAENHAYIDAPPDAVFDVLADARSYAHWVVGSSEVRGVEGSDFEVVDTAQLPRP